MRSNIWPIPGSAPKELLDIIYSGAELFYRKIKWKCYIYWPFVSLWLWCNFWIVLMDINFHLDILLNFCHCNINNNKYCNHGIKKSVLLEPFVCILIYLNSS